MSTRIAALLAVLAAALTLGGGAGAGAASQPPKIDLTSPAAIDTYLRSIGVDPAKMVKQAGLKNYAGPSCPGVGWNCTTAPLVVQVSTAGGENGFQCSPSTPPEAGTSVPPNECVVVQVGPNNHAHCVERDSAPDAAQTCTITQSGARNQALVDQSIDTRTSSTASGTATQNNTQSAHVTQQPDSAEVPPTTNINEAQVHQSIKQSLTFDTTQVQDAFQQVFVIQDATGSENFSHVHQAQDQNESGSAATQSQNTGPNTLGDCADDKVPNPNQCVNVSQDGGLNGAKNASHVHQAIGERQSSSVAGTQTQGRNDGGQEGDVHQQNPTTSGQNLDFPHQDLRQWQSSAAGIHPIQLQATDPGCCGVGTQIGGVKNVEDIHQATTQSASEDAANQSSTIFGQIHQVNDPANSCRIDQNGRNNNDAKHFSVEGDTAAECLDLELATVCTSNVDGGSCQSVDPCDVNPACDVILTAPTFGREITMPDYDAEPSDYFGP